MDAYLLRVTTDAKVEGKAPERRTYAVMAETQEQGLAAARAALSSTWTIEPTGIKLGKQAIRDYGLKPGDMRRI